MSLGFYGLITRCIETTEGSVIEFSAMSLNNFRNVAQLPDDFIIRQINAINICHIRRVFTTRFHLFRLRSIRYVVDGLSNYNTTVRLQFV